LQRSRWGFAAPGETAAVWLRDPDPPVGDPGTHQEVAARRTVERGESALAEVDEEGNFVGVVPWQRLLAVLLWEHEEDMDRLGGFLRGASEARRASR
jgi:magnesium transporter